MASYDIEHSVPPSSSNTVPPSSAHPPPRRPDFSTFFSHLSNTTTATTQNPHATPMPTDIAALYRLLAEGYTSTRQSRPAPEDDRSSSSPLDDMIALLISEAEHPPSSGKAGVGAGVDQDFLDGLERVPRKSLRRGMECPICGSAFVDDPFPLVVRLPCDRQGRHVFDLECIAPWLRLHATCPLDREDLVRRKGGVGMGKDGKGEEEVEEEEDGEWDDMYA